MILCFLNLKGSQITLHTSKPVHRGQHMELPVSVSCRGSKFNWCFKDEDQVLAQWSSVVNQERNLIYLKTNQRGLQHLPRLRLETRFPFGLFVCWTYLRFEQKVWVFPKVDSGEWQLVSRAEDLQSLEQLTDNNSKQQGSSDSSSFEGIREYQLGESLSRVSWKHQARNPDASLLVKDFSSPNQTADWLSFGSLAKGAGDLTSLEQKLERLTFALLQLDTKKQRFGLALSEFADSPIFIEVSEGEEHLRICLEGLANYGLAKGSQRD